MDVVALVNGIWQSQYSFLIGCGLLLLVLWSSGFFRRLFRIIEEMMLSNWQLALLAATAIALSLASGYTTYDGLRNFTSAPLLSALITFGIQGVMLIVAWLIGESFASGMNQRIPGSKGFTAREAVLGMILGITFAALVFYWLLTRYDAIAVSRAAGVVANWARFTDVSLYFMVGLILLGVIAFNFRRGGDIATPYVQTVRLVAKNSMLWVMFLAAGAASVFFSFDSHFNAIFPADQRARAAEIRTLNQVATVVADIGERAQKVQIAEAERLFDTDGWKAYDAHLTKLAQEAAGSQAEIEKYFVQKIEDRRRGIIEQQERIAGAERGQTSLLRRRDELEAELQRLEPGVGALEAEMAKAQATYNETKQAIASKRIDASAEDGGVEGTMKRGRGPVYRQRMAELDDLQRKLSITDEPRFREAQQQRDRTSARIVSLRREIATINGEVAKYKGEAFTASQRIKTAESGRQDAEGTRIDPARVLPAFERARAAFRQQPDLERLAAVQTQCGNLMSAVINTPAKDKVRGVDCDPKQAAEAAAHVFALNAGLVAFRANCAGGSKLPEGANTDGLLSFGRKCLQESGLVSQDSADIGARLQSIEMNRDDKAHRFVVTWNAFNDGNRLAYLALVLAIGVDTLVLMAGLFGAAAVKSPLSDVPSSKARTAEQLEAVIDTALLPHPYENAQLVLDAIQTREGYAHQITLLETDPRGSVLRRVLNAGSTIGAVRHVRGDTYELRSELFEYLSLAAKKAFAADKAKVAQVELEQTVSVALLPNVRQNVDTVLHYVQPIEGRRTLLEKLKERHQDFTSEIKLDEVDRNDRKVVRNVLNAGATHEAVQRENNSHYFLSRDFYRALSRIRARFLDSAAQLQHASPIDGGKLNELLPAVTSNGEARPRRLTHRPGQSVLATTDASARDQLKAEVWNKLLGTIGLSLEAASRIEDAAVRVHAAAAWQALQELSKRNERLRTYLDGIVDAKTDAIDYEEQRLRSAFDGDSEKWAVLDEVMSDLHKMLRALLLLPEVGVVREIVERLEQANGTAAGEEQLLTQLRSLEVEIRRIDRGSPDGWIRIAHLINGQDRDVPATIREMNPVNDKPY